MTTATEQKVEINVTQVLKLAPWIVLGLAAVLFLMGFGEKEYGYLIGACFLGIVARVVQAEQQHRDTLARRNPASGI